MLMDWRSLRQKYELAARVTGVLHIGAHLAEEAPNYDQLGDVPVWWVEANHNVIGKIEAALAPYPLQTWIAALVTDIDGDTREFHVTNYDGMSSSVLEFGTHPTFSPDTVFVDHVTYRTTTIDTLVASHDIKANMLVMDIQGAEKLALLGAAKLIPDLDFVMSEINSEEVYVGCAHVTELDAILHEFSRVETYWVGNQGWGDALWIRR